MELSKVRSFYAKKVETLQRKHQGQVSALRRGLLQGGEGYGQGQPGHQVHAAAPASATAASTSTSTLAAEKQELQGRVALLEAELLRSAEEIGRIRALNATAAAPNIPPRAPLDTTDTATRDKKTQAEIAELLEENTQYGLDVKRLERQVRSQEKQISQLLTDRDSDDDAHASPRRISSVQRAQQSAKELNLDDQGKKFEQASEQWHATKSELELSVKTLHQEKGELEKRITELQRELLSKAGEVQHWQGEALRLEMMTHQAKTPQMQQFLVSAVHLVVFLFEIVTYEVC